MFLSRLKTGYLSPLRRFSSQARRRLSNYRFFAYLAILGPGIIAANAGNDAGGIATYSSAGAAYGYTLLWTLFR
jgi:Mn2+/Fe2+ NRAMP family transporter